MLSKENSENIPEIKVDLESKEIKSGIVMVPYILVTTPYATISDKNGTRKVWIKSKQKIFLYYAYQITRIKWFIKQYNK